MRAIINQMMGLGLGLAVVQGIVNRHGGAIRMRIDVRLIFLFSVAGWPSWWVFHAAGLGERR